MIEKLGIMTSEHFGMCTSYFFINNHSYASNHSTICLEKINPTHALTSTIFQSPSFLYNLSSQLLFKYRR